jgi:hypothetical protein
MPDDAASVLRDLDVAITMLRSLPVARLKPKDLTRVYETVGATAWLIEKCEFIAYSLPVQGVDLQRKIWQVYEIFNNTINSLAAAPLTPEFAAELEAHLRAMAGSPAPGDPDTVVWLLRGCYPDLGDARAIALYLNSMRLDPSPARPGLSYSPLVRTYVSPSVLRTDYVVCTPRWVPRLLEAKGCRALVHGIYEPSEVELEYLRGLLPDQVDAVAYDSTRCAARLLARDEPQSPRERAK